MSSQVALAFEEDALQLRGMASKLERTLSTEGKIERALWDEVHGTLGKIAGYLSYLSHAHSGMTTEALLSKLRENMGPQNPGHPEVAVLLPEVRVIIKARILEENADSSEAIDLLKYLLVVVAEELDMFPLCDSIHRPMIQEYTLSESRKEYTFHEEDVNHMIQWSDELSAPNAPYTVVSIVGAQSSGKSYLLNQLFGTDFHVMDAQKGRRQTTKGILIARCIMPSLLVLDVEGFDGRERGTDTSFEKKAALFALTTSDLMMVNISVHDIGREQGGGATLFKTIFQERTKLPPCLTKIIVVVRHYDGETPVDVMEFHIMENLEEMWRSVQVDPSKPVIFKDYIEVKVVALPEKAAPDFRKKVTALRKLLSESTRDQHRSARVPASSFSFSSRMLWDQINQNKRLDLPSHKLMISTVYCQRIVEEAIKYYDSGKGCNILIAEESPRGFKEASDKLLESIIAKYDKETDMYDAGIRKKEREKLEHGVKKSFIKYSRELIHKMREKTSEQFRNEFVKILRTLEESGDALTYRSQLLDSCREKFNKLCEDLKSFDADYFHKICGDLQQELNSFTTYQILEAKEERARNELASAQRRSDKNVQELQAKLDVLKLELQHMKEKINRDKEKHEHELKLAKEKADRKHQKAMKVEEEQNKVNIEKMEKLKKEKIELEEQVKKGEGSCSIL